MMYCTVMSCYILCRTVLYCDVLLLIFSIVLYCIVICALNCIVLYCIISCMLCCIVLLVVLYSVVSCVVMCCGVLREGKRLSSKIFLSPNKMMSENFELY